MRLNLKQRFLLYPVVTISLLWSESVYSYTYTEMETQRPIVLALNQFSDPSLTGAIIEPTIETLKQELKGNLVVRKIKLEEIIPALQKREIDLVLTSSGFLVRARSYGLRNLVTVVNPLTPNPNLGDGSAFIVLSERKDLQTLANLKGKTAVKRTII